MAGRVLEPGDGRPAVTAAHDPPGVGLDVLAVVVLEPHAALTERLARVHDYRERLLGELSHDMRAPLQVVITRSEQLLRSDPSPDTRAQVVNIRIAALGALEQINDMLEQVKADHGEARLTLVDADLSIRWISHSATWVTGTDPEARQGASSLERIHPDDVEKLLHGLEQRLHLQELVAVGVTGSVAAPAHQLVAQAEGGIVRGRDIVPAMAGGAPGHAVLGEGGFVPRIVEVLGDLEVRRIRRQVRGHRERPELHHLP